MTRHRGQGLTTRLAVGTAALLTAGTVLTACGASGTGLAQQACVHVDRSIRLLTRATTVSDPARAGPLRQQAYLELLAAVPIAAQAAFHDGQWQALMTTLSESNRVPEETLLPSLRAQCQVADSSVFGQQQPPPSSIPPPAPGS